VSDCDGIGAGAESPSRSLGLLEQAVHRLDVGVAAMLRCSTMPRTTASKRSMSVVASFLECSRRLRRAQLSQARKLTPRGAW